MIRGTAVSVPGGSSLDIGQRRRAAAGYCTPQRGKIKPSLFLDMRNRRKRPLIALLAVLLMLNSVAAAAYSCFMETVSAAESVCCEPHPAHDGYSNYDQQLPDRCCDRFTVAQPAERFLTVAGQSAQAVAQLPVSVAVPPRPWAGAIVPAQPVHAAGPPLILLFKNFRI